MIVTRGLGKDLSDISRLVVFGFGGVSTSPAVSVTTEISGGIPKRRFWENKKYRRWILPNGDSVLGTYDDVVGLLQTAVIPKTELRKKKKVIARLSKDSLNELVVFKPLQISRENIVKINLSEFGAWKPDKKAYMDALIAIEEENEVIQLFLMN